MSLIGILIVIYFCYSQFKAERPRRFRYLLLPLDALLMFVTTFKLNATNLLLATVIILLGIAIGTFQGRFAQLSLENVQGQTKVSIRGGWPFLLGWGLILGIQILLSIFLAHHQMDAAELSQEVLHSALEELLPFRRIYAFDWWILWALSGSSSLAYTGMLAYRSPDFWQAIRRRSHRKADKNSKKRDA